MGAQEWRAPLARYGAPIAFLAAVTAAALLVRAGLNASNDRASTPSATVTSTVPAGKRQYYRVRPGDTLGVVAERFDTTLDDLVALNPQVDPNALDIGQRLRIH
jgi:peptidoglycan endopeptidase LytE